MQAAAQLAAAQTLQSKTNPCIWAAAKCVAACMQSPVYMVAGQGLCLSCSGCLLGLAPFIMRLSAVMLGSLGLLSHVPLQQLSQHAQWSARLC